MQRDLVEKQKWISRQDYVEGLALAQLAPGPLAAQLAIYLGWVRAGVSGATLVAAAFILMTRGVPLPYVATLLCTLGAFSVYPMLIVGRTMSWRTSARVFAAVVTLGILSGVAITLV